MSDEIRAALATLDPKNENHWTEGGQPRLDALGLTPVPKRADVTAAAPLFSRSNPEVPASEKPKEEPVVEQPKPKADTKLEGLQSDLDAAQALVADQQAKLVAAQKALAEAQVERDKVITELEKNGLRKDHENIMGIRAVLERSKAERAAKAEIANELRKVGVTEKLLRAGSPLDQAMARKRGFGLQRPNMQQNQKG